jgi:ABC-2 type transport system permease protein
MMLAVYAHQIGAAIRVSLAHRTNFVLQMLGMLLNNAFFFLLWILFFAGFRSVGGWRFADVCLLLGSIMVIVGAAGVLAGGYRDMAAAILNGQVDALLTQPMPVLPRLLAADSFAHAWGDLVNGVVLLAIVTGLDATRLLPAIAGLALGLTVYLSVGVTFTSLAFWTVGARSFARDLVDFLIMLSSYPGSIYSGATKFIAYTVLPAGFVVLTPVQLLRAPTLFQFAVATGAALAYAAIAITLFRMGLRRYQRGEVTASPG